MIRPGLLAALVLLWPAAAGADLYRWIDPETGSIKYSSYPPPWYGDPAAERRAPKVEHIPAGREPAAARGPAASAAAQARNDAAALEAERKAMVQQIARLAGQPGVARDPKALEKQLEAYGELSERLDKLDPSGSAARRAEMQALLEKLIRGEAQ